MEYKIRIQHIYSPRAHASYGPGRRKAAGLVDPPKLHCAAV